VSCCIDFFVLFFVSNTQLTPFRLWRRYVICLFMLVSFLLVPFRNTHPMAGYGGGMFFFFKYLCFP
jgi:hypothetical protein